MTKLWRIDYAGATSYVDARDLDEARRLSVSTGRGPALRIRPVTVRVHTVGAAHGTYAVARVGGCIVHETPVLGYGMRGAAIAALRRALGLRVVEAV